MTSRAFLTSFILIIGFFTPSCPCTTSPIQPQPSFATDQSPQSPIWGRKYVAAHTRPVQPTPADRSPRQLSTRSYPQNCIRLQSCSFPRPWGFGGVGSPESTRLNFSNVRTEEEVCYLPQSHSPPHQPNPPSPPLFMRVYS